MNVVTLTKSYPVPGSPAEGSFIESRMAAVSRRARVTVLHAIPCLRRRPPDGPELTPPVVRARYFYVPGALKSLDGRLLAACVRPTLRRLAHEGRLDVLDAHFGYPEGDAARRLSHEFGVPFVLTLRGTEVAFLGRGRRGALMAEAIRAAERVVAVSGPLGELARRAGADARRVRVIGNGADVARFTPGDRDGARRRLSLPPGADVVLSVGALIERKGLHHLVDLMPWIRRSRPEAVLVVVGAGPLDRRLRHRAAEVGVANVVRFEGLKGRDELPDYYRAANVLALASSHEGFANVFLEAFASGIPVVATDVGGAREAVPPRNLGRLVPHGDWAAFGAALLATLADPPAPATFRAHAEAHTWDDVGDRVAAILEEAVEERRMRA